MSKYYTQKNVVKSSQTVTLTSWFKKDLSVKTKKVEPTSPEEFLLRNFRTASSVGSSSVKSGEARSLVRLYV